MQQGPYRATARQAVIWIDQPEPGVQLERAIVYLEGDVRLTGPGAELTDQVYLGSFQTSQGVDLRIAQRVAEPGRHDPLFNRASQRRWPPIPPSRRMSNDQPQSLPMAGQTRMTAYQDSAESIPPGEIVTSSEVLPPGTIRIRAYPRGDLPFQLDSFPSENGSEQITVLTEGVTLRIDGVEVEGVGALGAVDLSADRMVLWTQGLLDLSGQNVRDRRQPVEVYLEGNLVFRQGARQIFAQRMYYNVNTHQGVVLDAELLTPAPGFNGLVRLRAGVIRQLSREQFSASDAWISTSLLARPRYRWQSGEILLEDRQRTVIQPQTGQPLLDPNTGQPVVESVVRARANNNQILIGDTPIFYWPVLAANLQDPAIYFNRVRVRNDSIFGTQIATEWNLLELLRWETPPEQAKWNLNLEYYSLRGPAAGTDLLYRSGSWLGLPGEGSGLLDVWGVYDTGLDNLGLGRRALEPEVDFRYRILGRHRQFLNEEYRLTAELGWVSDNNFLEQYFETEWDEFKDQTTGVELRRAWDNHSWTVNADVRLNDAFTQSEWLPRGDFFWLGQPLWGDRLLWHTHAQLGYGRLRVAEPPQDPADLANFTPLPWEKNVAGERAAVRTELEAPVQLGTVKVTPYGLGEIAHWGEVLDGGSLQRLYYQVGIRANLPMWAAYPDVDNVLFNLHGLAHKVNFWLDASHAEANRDLSELPLYDPVDDDSTEHFRRRIPTLDFGGATPLMFDERFYALRAGLGSWVASPSTEIADDLNVIRLGVHQRWQTQRGLPGQRRLIDWLIVDLDTSIFPQGNTQNFGANIGLTAFDVRWHVGDRVTLLSNGIFDFFDQGQKLVSVGAFLQRPDRGEAYLGYRWLDGPVESQVLTASYQVRLTEKWATSYGVSVDFSQGGNLAQSWQIVRIGESFLIGLQFRYNESKDNFGVGLTIQPRFLAGSNMSSVARSGSAFSPAGTNFLE